jgi:5-methylthioadenosine/S-adenosylhomocysteine deaminase
MTTLLTARWVMPISSPPIEYGAVAIESGVIIAVGPEQELRPKLARLGPLETLPLGEAAICPGFVNVHTHLELTVMRGFLENLPFFDWIRTLTQTRTNLLTATDLANSAKWGALESIRAGVTTLADTGDSGAAMEALVLGGQRGIVFQEVFGPDIMQAKKSLAGLKKKVEALRRMETSLVRVGVSPHAPYTVSSLLLRLVTEYAERDEMPLAMHCAESQAEDDFMRRGLGPFAENLRSRGINWTPPGVSSIRYLSDLNVLRIKPLLIHCVRATEEDIGLLTFWGARVAHCPKSNAKFGHGIAPVVQMRRRGVAVGIGTDGVASNNSGDLIEESRFTQLLNRASRGDGSVLTPDEMLEWMTLGGALALGLEADIGTLEVGKDADITAVSFQGTHTQPVHDPAAGIIAAANAGDVCLTMVRGRILFDGREVKTLDEPLLRGHIQEIGKRMGQAKSGV